MLKNDRHSDRTSDTPFLANLRRLFYAGAAYVLLQTRRTETLAPTELAHAQASTLILTLFKLAVRVVPFTDRLKRHLPTSCPVKGLLKRLTELLHPVPAPSGIPPELHHGLFSRALFSLDSSPLTGGESPARLNL